MYAIPLLTSENVVKILHEIFKNKPYSASYPDRDLELLNTLKNFFDNSEIKNVMDSIVDLARG
jgi:hypothetical protein